MSGADTLTAQYQGASGTMGAYTDEYQAYTWLRAVVEQTAQTRGWSSGELQFVLTTVDAAHSEALAEASYLQQAENVFSSTPSGDLDTFWSHVRSYSTTWDGDGADELRKAIGAATVTQTSVNEQAEASSVAAQVAGAVTQTATDVKAVGTSRTTWIVVGLVAAAVVLVAVRRR